MSDGLRTDMLDIFQFHHPVREEFQRPALPPIWSLATRQMNQLGFSLAIQAATLWAFSWKASREGYFHIFLDKPLFDANDGAGTDVQHLGVTIFFRVKHTLLTLLRYQTVSRY